MNFKPIETYNLGTNIPVLVCEPFTGMVMAELYRPRWDVAPTWVAWFNGKRAKDDSGNLIEVIPFAWMAPPFNPTNVRRFKDGRFVHEYREPSDRTHAVLFAPDGRRIEEKKDMTRDGFWEYLWRLSSKHGGWAV